MAKRVHIAVDDDSARARQEVDGGLAEVFGLTMGPVAGTPDECVAGLRDVVAAGAELVVLNPLRRVREQMERLAAEVVPRA